MDKDDEDENHDAISRASDQITDNIKESGLIISDEALKINIPVSKVSDNNDESNEEEVYDEVQTTQKRKKWRAQKTKYY